MTYKHLIQWFVLVLAVVATCALVGCGASDTVALEPVDDNPFKAYAFGDDASLEVVTWNLHNFASDDGANEVELVAQAIAAMGADVVALQEIAQSVRFDQLMEKLPHWSGFQATSDNYQNLAYVWLDSTVTVRRVREIFTSAYQPLPRSPLVLEITWQDHDVLLINNHLKCCGDGLLDQDDPGDEENRRWVACQMMEEWIATEHPDAAVVLLGDLNDHLDDAAVQNVFAPFLDRPDSYVFADMDVATGPASGWSWGPGQGHLDHILVTDELFDALATDGSACYSIRIDRVLEGQFRELVSDHLPVGLRLPGAALP